MKEINDIINKKYKVLGFIGKYKNVSTKCIMNCDISRPTLYSYPEIKKYIDSNPLKKLKNKDRDKIIAKLENENKELKDYIKLLEKERDNALLEQFNSNEKLKNKENVVSLGRKN